MSTTKPGARRRQLAHGVESRQRILDAAFDVAAEYGYEGATISRITQRAELPASSIYWQFENKDDLLAAVVRANFDRWSQTVAADGELGAAALYDEVKASLAPIEASLQHEPKFWRLGLMLALERRPEEVTARAVFRDVRREQLARIEQWWALALAEHSMPTPTEGPRLLAQLSLAAADGLFLAGQIDEPFDVARVVSLLSVGLTAMAEQLAREA